MEKYIIRKITKMGKGMGYLYILIITGHYLVLNTTKMGKSMGYRNVLIIMEKLQLLGDIIKARCAVFGKNGILINLVGLWEYNTLRVVFNILMV